MQQTTSSNQRPIDVDLEIKKNMALCSTKKPSIMDMSVTPHLHLIARMMECKSGFDLLKVAEEFVAKMEQQLRHDICTIKDLS